MLMQFFHHEMDYVLFVYGFAFVAMAAICLVLDRERDKLLPWGWLAVFGLTHGISEWLDMFSISLGYSERLHTVRLAILAISYLALFEFGRRGYAGRSGKKLSPWLYIPVVLLAATGCFAGIEGLHAATRYATGLPAGILAAVAIIASVRRTKCASISLLVLGIAMAVYAPATGIIVQKASFFPASAINQESFVAIAGFPVQVLRGFLACLMALSVFTYHQHYRRTSFVVGERVVGNSAGTWFAVTIAALVAMGWAFTSAVGDYADKSTLDDIVLRARIAAASIDGERVQRLSGTETDIDDPSYLRIRQQLEEMKKTSRGIRSMCLLSRRDGGIVVLVDSTPAGRPGHMPPGIRYMKPPKEVYEVFADGKDVAIGPYSDDQGTFVSGFAPVADSAGGTVHGVLRIDMDAVHWGHTIAMFRLAVIAVVFVVGSLLVAFAVIQQRMWESSQRIAINEHRLSEAQGVAHIGSWTYESASGRYTCSDEMVRIFGYDPAAREIAMDDLWRCVTGEVRQRIERCIATAVKEGSRFEIEVSVARLDGMIRILACTAQPVYGKGRKVLQLMGTLQDITERKQMEESLRASETALSDAMDMAGLVHWEYDTDSRMFRLNDRFYSMLETAVEREGGYLMSLEAVAQRFVSSEDTHVFSDEIHAALVSEEQDYCRQMELRVTQRGGNRRHWLVRLMPARDTAGRKIGLKGTCQDITERKGADDALRESERRLSDIMEFYPDATMVVDREGRIITWNRAMEQLTGFKAQDMLGKGNYECSVPFYDQRRPTLVNLAMHPDKETLSTYSNLRWQGETLVGEVMAPKLRGGKAYLYAAATVLRNLRGEVVAAVESIRDITERKRMEESIRINESQLSDAMELAKLAYWEYDMNTEIFSFNNRFYALYGTTAEREGGYSMPLDLYIREFIQQEDAHIIYEELTRARSSISSAYLTQFDHRARRRDGEVRHIAVRLHVIKDAAGRPVKCYGVNQDTTGHKKMVESLQTMASRLSMAMDLARMAYWEYDIAADSFEFNEQVYMLYGTTGDREKGYLMSLSEYVTRFVHPEDVELVARQVTDAAASNEPHYWCQLCQKVIRRDGELRYIATRMSMSRTEDGTPEKLYGTIQDVTDSKVAEEESRRSMSLLRATIESTADGILVVDAAGRISDYNERFIQLWRIPHSIMESHEDQQAIEFVLDQLKNPDQFVRKVQELYENPEAESNDVLEFKDGRIFERYSRPQHLDGSVVGRVWNFRDVTERRRSEEEMRRREAALASVLLAAPTGIGVLRNRVILQVNQRLCEMTGYSAGELVNQNARMLYLTQDDYEYVGREKYRQIAERGTGTVETKWRRKDGSVIDVLLNSTPLNASEPDGEVTFTAMDITDHKRTQEQLRILRGQRS